MTCRACTGYHPVRIDAYPVGNPRASLVAAHRADEERTSAPGPIHVHYDQIHDAFAVIRTDVPEHA
ncbi:hypothetical protein OG302_29440 [Streptomyces sp. NBC_01283]|uniref:hypothetical protein n=1 Tax=Streptomyces sp. NBC_01283 TaxID=2903812 RepID=UPI00352C7690|nr:hypothetical protein OG302_29440 [Streptomyces sp. NBC_01283]